MQHCGKCPDAVAQIHGGIDAHSYLDAFSFTKKVVACWSWRRFRGCLWKVKRGSMDFIFIREKAAPGWHFRQRVVIITRPISHIRNTQEICRRYWRVRGLLFYP